MYNKTDVAIFKLDDDDDPGLAKVELLMPTRILNGYQCWKAKVIAIIKPSQARSIKIGKILELSEVHLSKGN